MTLIYFILILGIIVFIHELGHFIWAKKSGVYCYEFSLGFGPKLFSFNRKNDETKYCLRLIPVGGYVSMAGEEADDDKAVPKDKKLYNKPWYKKLIIVVAGVFNNFILGFVVLFIMALCYGAVSTKSAIGIVSKDSSAQKSGLKVGDVITNINGKNVRTWDDVTIRLVLSNGNKYQTFTVISNKEKKVIKVKPKKITDKDGKVSYSYGIGSSQKVLHGFVNSLKYASSKFNSMYKSMIVTIGALFNGKIGINALSGPVGIYSIVGQESKTAGLQGLLYLLAYLSINVGFINLLPFPAFDGYRALTIVIEAITRKKVNQKVDSIVNQIGLFILFALMIFITIKDVIGLFK